MIFLDSQIMSSCLTDFSLDMLSVLLPFFPAMIFQIVNPATPTEQEGTNTVHIAFGNMSK